MWQHRQQMPWHTSSYTQLLSIEKCPSRYLLVQLLSLSPLHLPLPPIIYAVVALQASNDPEDVSTYKLWILFVRINFCVNIYFMFGCIYWLTAPER